MKKRNMKRYKRTIDYLSVHAYWLIISLWLFKLIVFRPVNGFSYVESMYLLCGMLGFFCIFGIINDISYKKSRFGIFCNLYLAYGVYTCITYYFVDAAVIWVICIPVLVITVLCLVALFWKKTGEAHEGNSISKKLKAAVYASRRNFGVAMMLLLFFVSGRNIFYDGVAVASYEVVNAYGEDYNLSNNIEMISKIKPEIWETLSLQERVDVAQAIAYCEGNYLGLPEKLTVVVEDLGETTLGAYQDDMYKIAINTNHILNSPPEKVVKTILHESFHCYQECCIKVYSKIEPKERNLNLFHTVSLYAEEFENYIRASEDPEGYYTQDMEADARAYSIWAVEEYYRRIEEELGESE